MKYKLDNRIYMRKALNESGIYNTDNKNINAELSALEKGIESFCLECERVLGNCFIKTADQENVIKRISLFRNLIITDDKQVLQNQLLEKARVSCACLEDIKQKLIAVGIDGTVSEGQGYVNVRINALEGVSIETAEAEIKKYLPVYCSVNFQIN